MHTMKFAMLTHSTIYTRGRFIGQPVVIIGISGDDNDVCDTMTPQMVVECVQEVMTPNAFIAFQGRECLERQNDIGDFIRYKNLNKNTQQTPVLIQTSGYIKPECDLLNDPNIFWSIKITRESNLDFVKSLISKQNYELVFDLNLVSEDEIKQILFELSKIDLNIEQNVFILHKPQDTNSKMALQKEITVCLENGWKLYPTLPYKAGLSIKR